MKAKLTSKAIWGATLAALLGCVQAKAASNTTDAVELVRSIYKTDRQAFVAESLQLTERESEVFWPLYRSYRADMETLGDDLVKLVLEYADLYPNVPEDSARRLLKQYTALEEKLVKRRSWYLKRASKILPPAKVLRWAQLENRMDLLLRLQLAGTIPLIPTDKGKPGTAP